jgi:hypothetical protein
MALDIQALREGREPPSKEKQYGLGAAAGAVQTADANESGRSSSLNALGTAAQPRISRRAPHGEHRPSEILLQNLRKKSFAGALFLLGLLVFGLRISQVLRPHAAPHPNLATTTAAQPSVAQAAPAKTPEIPRVKQPGKTVARTKPSSAKVATPSSPPNSTPSSLSSSSPIPPVSPAMLEIEVEHKFAQAHLSIWVDDSLTYTHTLEGTDKKHLVVFHHVQGHEFHAMQLSPGKHLVRVQVASDAANGEQSATVTGEFVSGKEKMLHIRFTKQGKIDLSLE